MNGSHSVGYCMSADHAGVWLHCSTWDPEAERRTSSSSLGYRSWSNLKRGTNKRSKWNDKIITLRNVASLLITVLLIHSHNVLTLRSVRRNWKWPGKHLVWMRWLLLEASSRRLIPSSGPACDTWLRASLRYMGSAGPTRTLSDQTLSHVTMLPSCAVRVSIQDVPRGSWSECLFCSCWQGSGEL